MARTKIFRRSSDSRLTNTWQPILEGYGADVAKTPWLAEYAHNHAIFDNTTPIFESTAPGVFFQTPGSLGGFMGNPSAPTNSMTPFTAGGVKNSFSADANGSGDKFPSLLPVAIQVAAKTIGFDLVPVIPMDSPVGFLPYLDYLYAGGRTGAGDFDPYLVKIEGVTSASFNPTPTPGDTITVGGSGAGDFTLDFVGYSRVDGQLIAKVVEDNGTNTLATSITGNTITINGDTSGVATGVSLVSALENHISGFTSVSDADYATTAFNGSYLPETGMVPGSMRREQGENSKFRQMGLRMFTKFVEAETDQVSISATVEQIQDLNRVWNYDVISMLENVAVNDLAQSINKRLVDRVLKLSDVHASEINLVEGAGITTLDLSAGSFDNTSTLQRRLVTKVLELANLIYHRGRFGAGTFMVTNGRIASALADVAGYSIAQVPTDMGGVAGNLYPAGKVYGVQVYVDPNMSWGDTRLSIGRKGADEEPGVKFMPYIMAESLQTISEGTFSPKIGMKSRYAITEAGWHPETQYVSMDISPVAVGVLTGSIAPTM
jgi:Major capsid protein Gp23